MAAALGRVKVKGNATLMPTMDPKPGRAPRTVPNSVPTKTIRSVIQPILVSDSSKASIPISSPRRARYELASDAKWIPERRGQHDSERVLKEHIEKQGDEQGGDGKPPLVPVAE